MSMNTKKSKNQMGTILLVLSPILYFGIFHFGTQACRNASYILCNYSPFGILYIPVYIAAAIAIIGIILIVSANRKNNK